MSNPTPPPGWYPDPQNPQESRWWDGRSWGPATASPTTTAQAIPTHPAVVLGTGVFVLAIASLVFFWIPVLGLLLAAGALAWSIASLTRNLRTWKVVSATVMSSVSLVLGVALMASFAGGNDDPTPTVASGSATDEATEAAPGAPQSSAPGSKEPRDKQQKSESHGSEGAATYGKQPRSEREFVTIVTDGFRSFDKADTDLQQSEAIRKRNEKVCSDVGSTADSWTGVVVDVGANGEGKAWVEVEVAPNVTVLTWNNALSDTFDDTLIAPGSSMFENLVAMKEGDKVTFSGEFVRDDDACVQTTNVTQYFSGVDPQFLMRFSQIDAR
ncbi:DUF2510 domain-containing protein [Krasilnikoviella flava]|uniref:DUF2510 domain-containing protein n=1 Tax=Krasilnikoviella flava TaxID=526729 RepID=A0A1T5JJM1_9MICO|nr:DUF2510 domain-containing protein [Krasilnikoviella flava]SKC51343.1 Protein of unknown function [Krasilnikoviella flava]